MAIAEMYSKATTSAEPFSTTEQGLSCRRKRFTRSEYDRIAAMGIFERQRVELVEGEILCMSPISSYHNTIVNLCGEIMADFFKGNHAIRIQSSFVVPIETELEPDVAIVPGKQRDYLTKNPDNAVLIIEVADSSLDYDTTIKASLYARAGIPDYWAIDLKQSAIIVHRNPCAMPDQPVHFGYSEVSTYQSSKTISPLALPDITIPVSELVP